MEIKTFGPVDERSRRQLETCMKAGDADFGVLCADHHPGYSQPIGGAIAYEGYISPSGVGYDIACIAAGEQVQTADGYTLPVERAVAPMCADAAGVLRPVMPFIGTVARGSRPVIRIVLANGRSLLCTADHEIRTDRGWVEASSLSTDDLVLCLVYTGLPFEPCELPVELLRVAGYVNGDGHINANGRRVTLYTSVPRDAQALAADLRSLGYEPRIHARTRPNGSHESAVYVNCRELSDRLPVLGPVGSKAGRWGHVLDALRPLPRWARGAYLSAFASAEMSTPRLLAGNIPPLSIKQKGRDAIEMVAGLLRSLDFSVGVTRSDRGSYVAQLQGGEDEQIRFMAEIGFSRAAGKRAAAAEVVGHAWARREHLATRRRTQAHLRERVRGGAQVRTAIAEVAAAGPKCEPSRALGECAWSSVASVEPVGQRETWDIVTADPEEAFVAGGMAVHNCGNRAVRTDMKRADLGAVEPVMAEIAKRISFGMGVTARERVDHPVLDEIAHAAFEPQRKLAALARKQLGTVGSGNHYVNLFADEEDTVWVGVHFGSRGFGHKTASGFLAMAQGLPFDEEERKRLGLKVREGEMDSPPVLFEVDSEVGQGYIAAMQLAGRYAYAGRDAVVDKVLEILGAGAVHEVHNHHNFAFSEQHAGRWYWVVRKGCTPADPGQEGFVGATMGDDSVILEGVESAEAQQALRSTVHGAGRVMSRSQAAGRIKRRTVYECSVRDCDFAVPAREYKGASCPRHPDARMRKLRKETVVRKGRVDWPAVQERLRAQGIVLVGGGADEAPEVYKDLKDVLAAHEGTIRVKHTLTPLGVAMAGADVFDPYKD
jgi:tRNA-splicing ligase RtcB (3'-phosphate/5'-hydroxy nucleic acid ligase)